jgi:hypothetical protein
LTEVVEFLEVTRHLIGGGSALIGRMASCDQTVTYDGTAFPPGPLDRSSLEASQTEERNEITVIVPSLHAIGQHFLNPGRDGRVSVSVWRSSDITRSATGITANTATRIILGDVGGAMFRGRTCEMTIRPARKIAEQSGPRNRYQRQCRWDLYGPGCQVDPWIASGSGTTIVDGSPTGIFNYRDFIFSTEFTVATPFYGAGHIVIGDESRLIVEHAPTGPAFVSNNGWVWLSQPFSFPITHGMNFDVFPGCDHTRTDCHFKFNNLANWGGFASIPRDNPYRGNITNGTR